MWVAEPCPHKMGLAVTALELLEELATDVMVVPVMIGFDEAWACDFTYQGVPRRVTSWSEDWAVEVAVFTVQRLRALEEAS